MRAAIVVVLGACSYNPSALGPDSTPSDTAMIDPDAAPDAPAAVSCNVPDPTALLLCYQLDGDLGSLDDSSSNNLDVAGVTGFSPIMRTVNGVDSQAAMIDSSTVSAHIAQTAALELTGDYTIVGWLMPINPSAGNDGIFDHNGQWAFSVENQLITCWWSRTGLLKSTVPIANGQVWQLAACVVTGTTGCVYRIDETGPTQMSCRTDLTGAAPAGNSGLSIGSFEANGGTIEQRFRGAVDDLRVYTRALTVDELCAVSGRTSCQ